MKMHYVCLVGTAVNVLACSSAPDSPSAPAKAPAASKHSAPAPDDGTPSTTDGAFPAALPGYTRIVANTIKDIPPGGDVTKCQFLMAPLDHDVDVDDVVGYQSKFGHHLIAMTYAPADGESVGTEYLCMGSDIGGTSLSKTGQFLGAAANGQRSNVSPPEGVALRLRKGQGVQINMHFINTGAEPIDGDGVIDLKLTPTDSSKAVASLFANNVTDLVIPPGAQSTSSVDCPVESDIRFVMMGNHMHEHGISATTEIVHKDGSITDLHTDATWPPDAVSNPVFTQFPLAAPAVVHAGDIVRTSCTYQNETSQTLTFPAEMCSAVGMALSDNPDSSVPSCIGGTWFPNGF